MTTFKFIYEFSGKILIALIKQKASKIMQNQFTKYLHQKHHLSTTFYEHHRLQPRTVKTKDKIRSLSSGHLRAQQRVSKGFETGKINAFEMKNQNQPISRFQRQQISKIQIGRDLFRSQIASKPLIGPGNYQPIFRRSNSFGYITKRISNKPIPSKIIKETISQFLGPGRYSFQPSQHLLSNHRGSNGVKFNSEKLVRCIIPKERTENIHMQFNDHIETDQIWKRKLGPGVYNMQKAESKADRFSKIISLPVSMTARSSLAKDDKLPGPGYYKWSTGMTQKLHERSKKPRIQYQTVH